MIITQWFMGYITSMYNELNNKRKQCILCRITKGNTNDGKEWSTKKQSL